MIHLRELNPLSLHSHSPPRRTPFSEVFTFTLSFPLPNTYRILLVGPERPRPPHDNITLTSDFLSFELAALDAGIAYPSFGRCRCWRCERQDKGVPSRLVRFHPPDRLGERWIICSFSLDRGSPWTRLNGARYHSTLVGGADQPPFRTRRESCPYRPYRPIVPATRDGRSMLRHVRKWSAFKHTPSLISTPRAIGDGKPVSSTYAIYHPTNSNST